MAKNSYFENLTFQDGKKINVSERIDSDFIDILHWHPYAEILISLCDGNEVNVNFVNYRLKTNDIIFAGPGSLHSVHYVTEQSFLVIQFPPELLTVLNEFKPVLSVLSANPLISYDPGSADHNEIICFLSRIRKVYQSEDTFREAHIYTCLLSIFARVGEILSTAYGAGMREGERTDSKNTSLIAEACLYISENCSRQLTLDEVSHYIGMSKSHFSHLFRSYTNMTFVEFLTAERIRRAEGFFADSGMRVVDIAFESGFSSISSFNRSFRRIKGCSPTEFRRTRVD